MGIGYVQGTDMTLFSLFLKPFMNFLIATEVIEDGERSQQLINIQTNSAQY